MNRNRKRVRISLAPIQERTVKKIKEVDIWKVSQENKNLVKKNSELRMGVRKLMEERVEAGHRVEKARMVVVDLVSRFEGIKQKVEETSEIAELARDMQMKLNMNGDEDVNVHDTAFLMNDDEDKENQDPSRAILKPIHQSSKYTTRVADCSVYGFDD